MIFDSDGDKDPSLEYYIQKRYQQGLGSLMYLLKHSHPEISTNFRDLSKRMKR